MDLNCRVARADCRIQVNTPQPADPDGYEQSPSLWKQILHSFPLLSCSLHHFPCFLSFPLITGADSGHALEAGWFLMLYGAQSGDKEIHRTAIRNFVELPYQYGWDKEHGGLFYFLDVDGHCPTQVNLSSLHLIMFFLDTKFCFILHSILVFIYHFMISHGAFVSGQLEWNMKLWWPHCEALVAFLMAYSHTRKPELLEIFSEVYQYTFSHVS